MLLGIGLSFYSGFYPEKPNFFAIFDFFDFQVLVGSSKSRIIIILQLPSPRKSLFPRPKFNLLLCVTYVSPPPHSHGVPRKFRPTAQKSRSSGLECSDDSNSSFSLFIIVFLVFSAGQIVDHQSRVTATFLL